MIKATVWTAWGISVKPLMFGSKKPKCIFNGEIQVVPNVGDHIIVKDGFGTETIQSIIYDFVNNDVEIHINDADPNNEYGPCLRHSFAKQHDNVTPIIDDAETLPKLE